MESYQKPVGEYRGVRCWIHNGDMDYAKRPQTGRVCTRKNERESERTKIKNLPECVVGGVRIVRG